MATDGVIEFQQNRHGEWFWRFKAANGEELARSSETYRREAGARGCAELVFGDDFGGVEVKRLVYLGNTEPTDSP